MLELTPSFWKIGHHHRWYRIISLVVSITFLSSIVSPTLASSSPYSENFSCSITEISDENTCPRVEYFGKNSAPSKDLAPITVGDDKHWEKAHDQGFINNLIEGGGYLLHFIVAPLSNDEKENLNSILRPLTDNPEFYVEYADGLRPLFVKEFVTKAVGRGARSSAFSGDLKSAFPLSESGMFIKRNIAESMRNIRPLIAQANAKEDYQRSGEIIRNSLIGQALVLPLQIGMGFATASVFKFLDQPKKTCDYVGVYSKWGAPGSTLSEFSGKTADKLLALERPEWQWVPPLLNTALTYVIYIALNPLLGESENSLKRLAMSETAANALTTAGMVGLISYDNKYEKYQIFNVSKGNILDKETMSDIFSYSWPVVCSHLPTTIAAISSIVSIGLIGGAGALGAKKDFDLISLYH